MPKNSHAKARALRIPLKSHSSDRLAKYRNVLTMTAVSVCVGWLLAGYFWSENSGLDRYSPGPVSTAHTHLKCQDCHNGPMHDETFLSSLQQEQDAGGKLWHRASDQMCRKCHPVATPESLETVINGHHPETIERPIPVFAHSSNEIPNSVGSCASCHSEHNGFDVSPVEVVDSRCVSCHKDLNESVVGHDSQFKTAINHFDGDHPDFGSLQKDLGTLKFNHKLHMALDKQKNGDVTEEESRRYVSLECRFCHQPRMGSKTAAGKLSEIASDATTYDYMSMPTYKQNCQRCHEIEIAMDSLNAEIKKIPIEHGAEATDIREYLNAIFTLEAVSMESTKSFLRDLGGRVPNKDTVSPWLLNIKKDPDETARVEENLVRATIQVTNKCAYCHLTDKSTEYDHFMPAIKRMKTNTGELAMYESFWFKHASFNHSKHRDMECLTCHINAETDVGITADSKNTNQKPMIEMKKDMCVECHQTKQLVEKPKRPGPVSCTSCHTYHGGGNRIPSWVFSQLP